MKTSSSGEGCVGSPSRKPSIFSGAVSILSSLTMIVVSIYLLINTTAYNLMTRSLSDWLRQHNRDKEVGVVEIRNLVILFTSNYNFFRRRTLSSPTWSCSTSNTGLFSLEWLQASVSTFFFPFSSSEQWSTQSTNISSSHGWYWTWFS